MFKHFIKPKWQHRDTAVRLNAISELSIDKEDDYKILEQIARSDQSAEVQFAAIQKLKDLEPLFKNVAQASTETFKQQLIQFLSNPLGFNIDDTQVEKALSYITDQQDRKDLILNTLVPEIGIKLLEDDIESEILINIIKNAKHTKIRSLAIESIDNQEILKNLQKEITDKNVLKIIRNKIKQQKERENQEKITRESLKKLCQSLEKLARLNYETHYEEKLELIKEQWNSIEQNNIKANFLENYNAALQICQKTIASHKEEQANNDKLEQAKKEQQSICHNLNSFINSLQENSQAYNHQGLNQFVNINNILWEKLKKITTPLSAYNQEHDKFNKTLLAYDQSQKNLQEKFSQMTAQDNQDGQKGFSELSYLLLKNHIDDRKEIIKAINWPNNFAKPEKLLTLENNLHEAKKLFNKIDGEQKSECQYIHKKTAVLKNEIKKRNLVAANKLYGYLNKRIEQLDEYFSLKEKSRIEPIADDLQELSDWNQFATKPKKQALCERMEKLADNPLKPTQQAEQVKRLQQEWKDLLSSRFEHDEELWGRFKQASDKAYEPCLAYYSEKDKQRANNLKQCMHACDMLENYYISTDWDDIDWKDVVKIEQAAKQEWQTNQPVPANEKQAIQKRFDQIVAQIRQKLDEEREVNLQTRKDLVAKAVEAESMDDLEKSINKILFLQKQWKQAGLTYYKADKEQWQLFREACDKIFAKRNQQRDEEKQKLQAEVTQVSNLIEKIKELSNSQDNELLKTAQSYNELKQEFHEKVETLAEHKQKTLKNKFRKACQVYEQSIDNAQQRKVIQKQEAISQAAEICIQAEKLFFNDKSCDINSLQQNLDALNDIPKSIKSIFEKRLDKTIKTEDKDKLLDESKTNQEKLKKLAIQLEVLADIDSPADYKDQRMQYQLDCLQQGIQTPNSKAERNEKIQTLLLDWYAIGAVEPESRVQLQERLNKIKPNFG